MTERSAGDWRPTADREALRLRARVLGQIRAFFAERSVLEVETPLLASATVTDLHIRSLSTRYGASGASGVSGAPGAGGRRLYLQTSPEFAMKRLLASGSGAIYQICKAFRDGEAGHRHNPEFTMLEWYRPGWDHHRLMDEVDALLMRILGTPPARRMLYRDAVEAHAGFDPHRASAAELRRRAEDLALPAVEGLAADDRAGWRDLLVSLAVEPRLGLDGPVFVYDYPHDQAALARLRQDGDGPAVAERFEAYGEGLELANGYHELTDAAEQRRRFEADLELRRRRGEPEVPLDERLLAALDEGFPECAGVSVGVDRLVMLAAKAPSIREVIAFPLDRA